MFFLIFFIENSTYDNYEYYGTKSIDDDIKRSTLQSYDYMSPIAQPSSISTLRKFFFIQFSKLSTFSTRSFFQICLFFS